MSAETIEKLKHVLPNQYLSTVRKSITIQSLSRAFVLPIGILLLVIYLAVWVKIPLTDLMRDPTAVADIAPYVGFVSNIGILLWCATAVICLFSWQLLRVSENRSQHLPFIFWSGLLTVILMLDDLFLLHEDIFPNELGISQKIIIILYFGLVAGWLFYFRGIILSGDFTFLILALGFFGLSIGVDYLDEPVEQIVGQWRIFFEDGFKLLGIGIWLYYFASMTKGQLMTLFK